MDLERCVCGKSFVAGAGFSNHSRTCRQSKKRLSAALETAREAFRARKKSRISFSSILQKEVCSMLPPQLPRDFFLRFHQNDQNGPPGMTSSPSVQGNRITDVVTTDVSRTQDNALAVV